MTTESLAQILSRSLSKDDASAAWKCLSCIEQEVKELRRASIVLEDFARRALDDDDHIEREVCAHMAFGLGTLMAYRFDGLRNSVKEITEAVWDRAREGSA